jgi:DNA-directed RNA polymerase sigma subunit (sigma70/sigma32)
MQRRQFLSLLGAASALPVSIIAGASSDSLDIYDVQNPHSATADVIKQGNKEPTPLRDMLKRLSYRQRTIIKLRYGLEDGYFYTPEEIGYIFKVTPDCICRIEAKAIEKLCKGGYRVCYSCVALKKPQTPTKQT